MARSTDTHERTNVRSVRCRGHTYCVEREFLETRLTKGLSLEEIGRETGLHASTVAYWAKKHGLTPAGAERFAPRGAPDREALGQLVSEGATLQEIAEQTDRSIATVRYWLAKWGIERPKACKRVDAEGGPSVIERQCGRHGLTRFGLESRGYYRCLLCRQERVSEWRRRVKRILVDEAGGACQICGYQRCVAALQFHHLNRAEKSFALSDEGVARNLSRARAEAEKCVLVCANCHAEVEAGYVTIGDSFGGG